MKKSNKLKKILNLNFNIKQASFQQKMRLTRDTLNLKIIIKLVRLLKNWKQYPR
jgi:hypothetical protein